MWQTLKESKLISYVSLFTSFGTLICCAIPSTLVLLGFGAGVAGFVGEYPQFIWLSEHKEFVFGMSFLMLGISWFSQKYQSCPIEKKEECLVTRQWSKKLFLVTMGINLIGATYAFVLPRLL
jgi:uncharacterized membrane protein